MGSSPDDGCAVCGEGVRHAHSNLVAPTAIKLAVPAKLKLRGGIAVRVTLPGAGKLSARLAKGARAVASGTVRAAAAGQVSVRMKLHKRVRVRKLRGKKLVLRVEWTGAAGGSAVATARVKAR
jgi:hypothetical protein